MVLRWNLQVLWEVLDDTTSDAIAVPHWIVVFFWLKFSKLNFCDILDYGLDSWA